MSTGFQCCLYSEKVHEECSEADDLENYICDFCLNFSFSNFCIIFPKFILILSSQYQYIGIGLIKIFLYFPANENRLKWIEMDSDFQKYLFTNVKMNAFQSWMHFYSFIEIAWSIFMPFNLKIILIFLRIVNTIQFKILNRKNMQFFNPIAFNWI